MNSSTNPLYPFGVSVEGDDIILSLTGEQAAFLAKICHQAKPQLAGDPLEHSEVDAWCKVFAALAAAATFHWRMDRNAMNAAERDLVKLFT